MHPIRHFKVYLAAALVFAMLLLSSAPALAFTVDEQVADGSTMNHWVNHFNINTKDTTWAGGVWMDKSVFTDVPSEFTNVASKVRNDNSSFVAALSVISSTESYVGQSYAPVDVMIILDISSSMYTDANGDRGTPVAVRQLLQSVNDTITTLLGLNPNNRVGVTIYYGGDHLFPQAPAKSSQTFLPLGRYTRGNNASYPYLQPNVEGGKLTSIQVTNGVKNENGAAVTGSRATTGVAGTYAQQGIHRAMLEFVGEDENGHRNPSYTTMPAGEHENLPVFVFMSDGRPTAAHEAFDNTIHLQATMGNNSDSRRYGDQTDFVTLLTAAYAKQRVDEYYTTKTPLFFTLSLGTNSVSGDLMDPANHSNATINNYWETLLNTGEVSFVTYNFVSSDVTGNPPYYPSDEVDHKVTRTRMPISKTMFPSSMSQRLYADKTFTAATADQLPNAFRGIVQEIEQVSQYTPTYVFGGNDDLSGNVSFVDTIGEYMTVLDIKGIKIAESFHSGAPLARALQSGSQGTAGNPTPFGVDFLTTVRTQLGMGDDAGSVITAAIQNGQIYYNSNTDYSNYISWIADSNGDFIEYWNDKLPYTPTHPDATYYMKSYFYLGSVDHEDEGVLSESNLMYAYVWHRKEIAAPHQETIIFSVPSALIPTVNYHVTSQQIGGTTTYQMEVDGAEYPIKLLYEVGLQDNIRPYTLFDVVSNDYRTEHGADNIADDGGVYFYTNDFNRDRTYSDVGNSGLVNTTSYFYPSKENPRYFYTEDTYILTDKRIDAYCTSDPDENGVYYRPITSYKEINGTVQPVTEYRELSKRAINAAKPDDNGRYYIEKGVEHVNLDGYFIEKSADHTNTLTYSDMPHVRLPNAATNTTTLIVGATLGNNGRIKLNPTTGLMVKKQVTHDHPQGAESRDTKFTFWIRTEDESELGKEYPAAILRADGTLDELDTKFKFEDHGQDPNGYTIRGSFEISEDETFYLYGMEGGKAYTVWEVPKGPESGYTIDTINGQSANEANYAPLTTQANEMVSATFVNTHTEKLAHHQIQGSKTLLNKALIGSDYTFQLEEVELVNGVYEHVPGTRYYTAVNGRDGSFSFPVMTFNEAGTFYFRVQELNKQPTPTVPEGTIPDDYTEYPGYHFIVEVTVTETDDNKLAATQTFKLLDDADASTKEPVGSIEFVNTRRHYADLVLRGAKHLEGRTLQAGEYQFGLYTSNANWELGTLIQTVSNTDQETFEFPKMVFSDEHYRIGRPFYCIIKELPPANAASDDVFYDPSEFRVKIELAMLDDKLWVLPTMTRWDGTTETANWSTAFFTNEVITPYQPDPLAGHKRLAYRKLKKNQFTFELREANDQFASGALLETVQNDESGVFAFSPLVFTHPGTYNFLITEKINPNDPNVVFDATVYRVTYTVSKNPTSATFDVQGPVIRKITKDQKVDTTDDIQIVTQW